MKYLLLLLALSACTHKPPKGTPYGYHEYAVDMMVAERDSIPPIQTR